ncbi:TPA: hypothetical protein HA278_01810 [Candidatus Woesearchaeota archaeon]|nr:hypothetical protein [Candidatus Woesearchaeota archaeon]
MRELIKNYLGFDQFLKDQLMIGLFIQCTWALVSPLIIKLQGLLWTTTYIAVYMIMMRMAGLFVPYFKGTHIKKAYKSIVFMNILYVLATALYFYDQSAFLWTECILSVFFCINLVVLGIGWDVYVVDKYEKETFENFKYCAAFRDGLGGIGGYSVVIFIYSFLDEYESMKLFVFLMLFVLLLQLYNYVRHYKEME